MLIAQITDMHVSVPGRRADTVYRTAEHLALWVERLNRLTPRPDVVLATGDLVNDGEAEEYARLADLLRPLAMPVFLIPGNHDDRGRLAAAFPGHAYLPRDGGFQHYAVEDWPVRLIALDTLRPGAVGGEFCAARADWLRARLAEAPERATLIFMHHPPFRTGIPSMDAFGLEGAERLIDVLRPYDNVERIVCGHLHRPIQRRIAGTIASTAPATAHQVALIFEPSERVTMTQEPPACQLHLWLGPKDGLVSHTLYLEDNVIPRA